MDTRALTIAHARVKAILDEAAGESSADYGGAGRFWTMGARALEEAEIFGVKMVAPLAAGHACCAPVRTRSAASGLIKGLRGEAPFDGDRFPRYRGRTVSPSDIDHIAEWIDAGCPDETTSVPVALSPGEPAPPVRVRTSQIAEFAVAADGYSPTSQVGEPGRRMNIDCMGEAQLDRLRRGFRQLYALNRWPEDRRSYNNQALIHQNHCQHGWERFLPWHRAYLYEFEQNLQGFEPGLMLPYWDFTMPEYRPEEPDKGCIIPKSMKAYLTKEAAVTLLAVLDPAPTADQKKAVLARARERTYFTSQHHFFCHLVTTIGYGAVTHALWYPLRYPAEYAGGGTINQVIHYHYPSAVDITQILSLNNFRDFGGGSIYDAAFGFLDQNPHNTMHIWTGGQRRRPGRWSPRFHARSDLYSQPGLGDMFSNLTASYDSVSWPIHVNIDRIWWEWSSGDYYNGPYWAIGERNTVASLRRQVRRIEDGTDLGGHFDGRHALPGQLPRWPHSDQAL
ncbi:tyrosinase [Bradyrhizobium sp. USDA 4461]